MSYNNFKKFKEKISHIPFNFFSFLLFLIAFGFPLAYIALIIKNHFSCSILLEGRWIIPLSFTCFLLLLIAFILNKEDNEEKTTNDKINKKNRDITRSGRIKQRKLTRKERAKLNTNNPKDFIKDTKLSILMCIVFFNMLFPLILKIYFDASIITYDYLDVLFIGFLIFDSFYIILLLITKKLPMISTFCRAFSASLVSLMSFLFAINIFHSTLASYRFINLFLAFIAMYLLLIGLFLKHLIAPPRITYPKIILVLVGFLVLIYFLDIPAYDSSKNAILLIVFAYLFTPGYAIFYSFYGQLKHRPRFNKPNNL